MRQTLDEQRAALPSLGELESEMQDVRTHFRHSPTLDRLMRAKAEEEGLAVSKLVRLSVYRYLGIVKRRSDQ